MCKICTKRQGILRKSLNHDFSTPKDSKANKKRMKLPTRSNAIDVWRSKASQLLAFLEAELSTFDTLEEFCLLTPNKSQLFLLTEKLKLLDISSVSNFINEWNGEFDAILCDKRIESEANIHDGRVFSKRGAPKNPKNDRRERQSFSSTSYGNSELILTTESIKTMSDMNFIFSLNAFFLPYCDSNKQRNMYEHFFDVFLKVLHEREKASSNFLLLQESVMIIQKISEAWMNSIEVLLEMLNIGFIRIKTHQAIMTPNLKSSFNTEITNETEKRFNDVLRIIASQEKVYRMIGTGSLTDANSKRAKIPTLMMTPENHIDKFNDQVEILSLARQTDVILIETSVIMVSSFVSEFPDFTTSLRLYIESFRTFSDSMSDKTGIFHTFASSFMNMCKSLSNHESNLNVVLESPRRSPKDKWYSPRRKSSGETRERSKSTDEM
jgi:hypothetical protein